MSAEDRIKALPRYSIYGVEHVVLDDVLVALQEPSAEADPETKPAEPPIETQDVKGPQRGRKA